ncbi:MAG TPA: SpoIIE family protein phosphatase [Desulfobacterales bacterium]
MFSFKHMQSRLTVFTLLPVALLLVAAGWIGFFYATDSLLAQWRKAAILQLQQEAHQIDMLLARPKQWIEMFHRIPGAEPGGHHIRDWVLKQLQEVEGVQQVHLRWINRGESQPGRSGSTHTGGGMGHFMHPGGHGDPPHETMSEAMGYHHGRITEITPPQYGADHQRPTVSLISNLLDADEEVVGRLEVSLRFEALFANMGENGVWQSHQAYIVDDTGRVLFSAVDRRKEPLAADEDSLEQKTLEAIKVQPYGTVMGAGYPPNRVSGFYRLMEAPWTLVIVAPGNKILAPILRFGGYFLLFGSMFVVIVLVLIRWGTGQTVTSIKTISRAAEKVAGGDYEQHLPVNTADEVGELTRSFNAMTSQLQERMRLKRAMDLAMEVQQNLLPQQALNVNGVDIYGKSLYCDETGGDYYDFIHFQEMGPNRIGIAVGDVVGHGVAAALIMSSVRAFLRSAVLEKTALSRVADHVNRLLCNDTTGTGNFMTLFFLELDTECRELRWVRAGHDPAMVYDSRTEVFQYLKGEGLALGVDANWQYEEYRFTEIAGSTVILIGTDGLWETENERGEKFGRDRLRAVLKQNSQRSSQEIVETILAAINSFRGDARQADDITLVVVRNLSCIR